MLGIIGGTGLYDMEALEDRESVSVDTPFGAPSDDVLTGVLAGSRLAFLPRHGRGHRLLPSELNSRANIWALKKLGVDSLVSVSAVGSLREDIAPGDLVLPDQFIDRTWGRESTFFGDGLVAHVAFGDPVCGQLSARVFAAAEAGGARAHRGGTYVCIQGPAFSTRAESRLFRSWGGDVVGMTNLPEARLAREAELCFATLALATDYDCWREEEAAVDAGSIMEVLAANVTLARDVVTRVAASYDPRPACDCQRVLDTALVSDRLMVPAETNEKLALLLERVDREAS
ncbi:MAG TPA: S-methyl-5'-thioadenosine phosphorylase [Deltaproteobacteria bacterium]|nr:S-methyl-5'-thioadenosine phosphorylase [Candidatus Binatota bacterium]HIL12137.1 S-methyl-5'-thioadenosine phosphorylase [Deltaproteobacteria bacterium]